MSDKGATPDERTVREKARRNMTYLAMFAIVMFFAGLSSAYIVSMSGGYWTRIRMPEAFVRSTLVIIGGSFAVHMALLSARKGRSRGVTLWLVVTLCTGLSFTFSQFSGWAHLVSKGVTLSPNKLMELGGVYGTDFSYLKDGRELVLADGHFYAPDDMGHARPLDAELEEQRDRTGPYLYALTVLHFAHLAFGLLFLVLMLVKAIRGLYTPQDHIGLWAGATYWHFLAGLWVYLLLFLSLVH